MQKLIVPELRKCSLLIAIILLVTLLWGEIFTRILLPQNVDAQTNIFQSDDELGIIFKPNAMTYQKGREYNELFQINSIGLRDREYGAKKKGVFRILLIGDSVAESHGMPIEKSLSRQLEKSLQKIADQDGLAVNIEVINAARGGASPYNYWRAYGRWKSILSPDIIIVTISPDDYDSSNAYMHYVVEDGNVISMFKEGQKPITSGIISLTKLRKWLSWNSEFYILLRNFFYYNEIVGKISQRITIKNIKENDQLQQYMVPQSKSMTKAWSESFSYIKNIKNETDEDGLSLIIIPVPMKLEIDPEEYRRILAASNLTATQLDVNQPLKQISNFCRQEKIQLLDPRPAICKRHAETPCYFVYDSHWNAEGLRTAAETIALQWSKLQLPPWNGRL